MRDANAAGVPADRLAPLQAGRVPGAPDVRLRTWPELHVEAKADERLSVDAMVRQAERDVAAFPGEARVPVVVYKRNRQTVRAVVPWEWLLWLLAELDELRAWNDVAYLGRRS